MHTHLNRCKYLLLLCCCLLVARVSEAAESDAANNQQYQSVIKPLLLQHCVDCHGEDLTEGNIRIDTLDPNMLDGGDTEWWIEVYGAVTKGEMPPPDAGSLSDTDRQTIVDWLSSELHSASIQRQKSGTQSAFRRMTRYEYNYALQDLLGLPFDFAKDLPPEPNSEEGFENNAELLQISVSQLETYRRIASNALRRATVSGPQPQPLYWGIAMQDAAKREWDDQAKRLEKVKRENSQDPEKLADEISKLQASFHAEHDTTFYKELSTGRTAKAEWSYGGARYAFAPQTEKPQFPDSFDCVAILPPGRRQNLVVELGNQLPDEGTMRVTVRASRVTKNAQENQQPDEKQFPSLQLLFGWQASNEGRALLRVSQEDIPVTGTPDNPQIIQWDVELGEIYPRNTVRKTSPMGSLPSPSEYIRFANASASGGPSSDNRIQIDYVTVEAPVYNQWPPRSHTNIFFESQQTGDELTYAKQVLQTFMTRAWRRPITEAELDRKLELFAVMRPACESFEEAVSEVLATVLASPQFLYVADPSQSASHQLATRLALFLWCSVPDQELLELASQGELSKPEVLMLQIDRMLADPKSRRFSQHFVHQWLNLQLLEYVNLNQKIGGFDPLLKEAMQQEPIELFNEVLKRNASVLDFIHCDYAVVNERLARHYGINNVYGNHFQSVKLDSGFRRGGLLTQAGTLTMNSDWPDSHPLKRATWLLECLLADPPPPPPPAVPQIDLANPEIAKMTLKERIEDHRNHAACMSCHIKIDPWGIAFENFDALGRWRDKVNGKPVDASSELFNHQTLDGMEGLKTFLLKYRQDQFVQAMTQKLATYALGRPLRFEDRAEIDLITEHVRENGDGLKTMIQTIVTSNLFRQSPAVPVQ